MPFGGSEERIEASGVVLRFQHAMVVVSTISQARQRAHTRPAAEILPFGHVQGRQTAASGWQSANHRSNLLQFHSPRQIGMGNSCPRTWPHPSYGSPTFCHAVGLSSSLGSSIVISGSSSVGSNSDRKLPASAGTTPTPHPFTANAPNCRQPEVTWRSSLTLAPRYPATALQST